MALVVAIHEEAASCKLHKPMHKPLHFVTALNCEITD